MSTDVSDGTDRPPKPDAPDVDCEAVPGRLTDRDQWLLWQYEWKTEDAKWAKVPLNPKRGHRDDATDPDVWVSFEEVKASYNADHIDCDGIGFAFADDDMIVGVDLDDCRNDSTGETEAWAGEILLQLDSWTEVSPSGTGYHTFVVGTVPDGGNRSGDIEMYDSNRFFTVTGNHVEATPGEVKERNDELANIHSEYVADDEDDDRDAVDTPDGNSSGDVDLTDDQLIKKAKNADNGDFFTDLWEGRWEKHRHRWATSVDQGQSEADSALCSLLAFWTGEDKQRIDTLFRKSGLMRDKWERDDYRRRTIQGAINRIDETYDPSVGQSSPPEPQGLTDEDGNKIDDDSSSLLTPWEFKPAAGLGDDDSIADLNDKQKAATVWRLIKKSDEYHIRCDDENKTIWAYDDGIWKPDGDSQLGFACRKTLGPEHFGNNVLRELKTQVRNDPHVRIERETLGVEAGKIPVENGLLDLQKAADGDGDALRPLQPTDYALSQLPVRYDADADTSECENFVRDVVESDKVDAVQEYVGYCLHRGEMPFHRALLLVGSGANGKSTFLNMVRELLGENNTESKPIRKFDRDNVVADLYGKIANIDADLSEGTLSTEGVSQFKKLTGNDTVDARQMYERAFSFKATVKHLYACNTVPDVDQYVGDNTNWFWRRWIIVEFPNWFPEGSDKRDHSLEDRLTSDENLSGVLKWAIEGYNRLMEQGHFTDVESMDETRRLWQSWGESVDEFIVACLDRDPDADNISTNALHQVYSEWCDSEGKHRMTQRALTTAVKNNSTDFGYNTSVRTIDKKNPINGYTAVGFTDEAPDLQEVLAEDDGDNDDETDDDPQNTRMSEYQEP